MKHKNHHKTNIPKEKPEVSNRRNFLRGASFIAGGVILSAVGIVGYLSQRDTEIIPLTFSSLDNIQGVRKVYETYGEQPDVIYLPYMHPNPAVRGARHKYRDVPAIEKICNHLYKNHGVRSILVEGITEELVNVYRQTGRIEVDSGNQTPQGIEDDQIISRMLSKRQWNLQSGEDRKISTRLEELRAPLEKITKEFSDYIEQRLDQLNTTLQEGRVPEEQLVQQTEKDMETYRKISQGKIDKHLTAEMISEYGNLVLNQRNSHLCQKALTCKNAGKSPLIIIYGDQHGKDLAKLLRSQGIGYALLLLEGYSSELPDADPNEVVKGIFNIPKISLRSD